MNPILFIKNLFSKDKTVIITKPGIYTTRVNGRLTVFPSGADSVINRLMQKANSNRIVVTAKKPDTNHIMAELYLSIIGARCYNIELDGVETKVSFCNRELVYHFGRVPDKLYILLKLNNKS